MAAITFPTDPANDELYTAPNGTIYIWDGEKWVVNSTIYTGPALENITQDRVAPMFVNGDHTGITFAYDSATNTLTSTVTGGVSVNDFGEGFTDSLDDGKITTSKLYNENPNQGLNNQYTLEVTDGGVVSLPDGSIINGATLKSVAGNYAGITAGPVGKDEDSWVWVDGDGAWIGTKYNTDQKLWHFNNDGGLTFPQGTFLGTADGTDAFIIDGAVGKDVQIYTYGNDVPNGWTFGADGSLTLPGNLSYPNTALQRDTGTVTCAGNASTVVYTASGQYQHTIRLLIQVEGSEGAPEGWDTQACEMIIAKSWRANDIAATVYGIVHTSVAPLATFSAEWNALTSRVEVLCATPSANTVYVRTFATEITTAD